MVDPKERRRHPRAPASFSVEVAPIATARVEDISLSGVRCVTSIPLSPMTLVALKLEIPTAGRGEDRWTEVPCRGVVVRSRILEDHGDPRYEAAILFQDLDPDDRRRIEEYVTRKLSTEPAD